MSLCIKEKVEVRRVRYGWMYEIDENRQPKYPNDRDEKPNYEVGELRQMVLKRLEEMGYTVYKVKPQSANCIVRVYKEEKEYNGFVYRILGAHCYTKAQDGKWKCIDRLNEEYGIDFSNHVLRTWFFQDEYWDASLDFFDTFIKLVKEN